MHVLVVLLAMYTLVIWAARLEGLKVNECAINQEVRYEMIKCIQLLVCIVQ
jgi:hypothetical protein